MMYVSYSYRCYNCAKKILGAIAARLVAKIITERTLQFDARPSKNNLQFLSIPDIS